MGRPVKVVDLDQKLTLITMALKLGTQERLAELLGISTSAISKWKDRVPAIRLESLANRLGISMSDLAELSNRELADRLERPAPSWEQVRTRARLDLIAFVQDESESRPPVRRVGPVRGIALENRNSPRAPHLGPYFNIDDRIYLKLTIPWEYFKAQEELHALILLTDENGTELITPLRQPRLIQRSGRTMQPHQVLAPEGAPVMRYRLEPPPGQHSFTVVFLQQPLHKIDPGVVDFIDPPPASERTELVPPPTDLAPALDATKPQSKLTSAQLNMVGNLLLAYPPDRWLVSQKGFYLKAG